MILRNVIVPRGGGHFDDFTDGTENIGIGLIIGVYSD